MSFVATLRESVQIGQEEWRMEAVSRVFSLETPMNQVLGWAKEQGISQPTVNHITFSELSYPSYRPEEK